MGTGGFNTRAIHAGQEPDPATGAVIVPVHLTTTYKQDGVGGLRGGYEYSRSANPTGVYEREVDVPAEWAGRRIVLQVGAAESVLLVHVDGKPAGVVTRQDVLGHLVGLPHTVGS